MPSLETMDRYQDALLFELVSWDRYQKAIVSSVPVELRVRWIDKQTRMMDPKGNTIAVDATLIADRELTLGSIVWKGGLDDLVGTASVPSSDFHEVKLEAKGLDLKGRVNRFQYGLLRYSNTLPTVGDG